MKEYIRYIFYGCTKGEAYYNQLMGNIQTSQPINSQKTAFFLNYSNFMSNSSSSSSSSSLNELNPPEIQSRQLSLPSLIVRQTPFTMCPNLSKNTNKTSSDRFPHKQLKWLEVIYHPHMFQKILDYLPYQDDHAIMLVNRRLNSEIYLHRINRKNHWEMIQSKLQDFSKYHDYDILSQNQQQSQHSMDLDRTQSFFNIEDDIECQVAKLDRVMRALNSSIPYFQGMNSIVAVLLSYFSEEQTFQISRLLVHKCEDIQNDCEKYSFFIECVEKEIRKRAPCILSILDEEDLDLEYFAMKWVLGIFSYDLDRQVLSILWGFTCIFGISALKWFIVSIFAILQKQLSLTQPHKNTQGSEKWITSLISVQMFEQNRADVLNSLLKDNLKQFVNQRVSQLLTLTKQMMIDEHFHRSEYNEENGRRQGSSISSNDQRLENFELQDQIRCPGSLWYTNNDIQTQIWENSNSPTRQKFNQLSPIPKSKKTP